jgi:hypothetical protein
MKYMFPWLYHMKACWEICSRLMMTCQNGYTLGTDPLYGSKLVKTEAKSKHKKVNICQRNVVIHVRSEILMVMSIQLMWVILLSSMSTMLQIKYHWQLVPMIHIKVLRDVKLCVCTNVLHNQQFQGREVFYPEDWATKFLQNVGTYLTTGCHISVQCSKSNHTLH